MKKARLLFLFLIVVLIGNNCVFFKNDIKNDYLLAASTITKVSLNKKSLSLKVGSSERLIATTVPAGGAVNWASTNKKVVTVDSNGNVSAVGSGNASIIVVSKDNFSVREFCSVTVTGSDGTSNDTITKKEIVVSSISLNKSSLSISKGNTSKLTVYVNPVNATNKSIKWSSSNSSVVTVDGNGTIKAVGSGSALVYAIASSNSSAKASCKITVSGSSNSSKNISANAQTYLNTLEKMSNNVEQAYKTSKPWKYKWIKPYSFSYQHSHTRKTSCIGMVAMGLIEMKVLSNKQYIQIPKSGFGYRNGAESNIKKKFTVNKIKYKTSLYNLIKNNKIKPGDIVIYKTHENVYAGNYNGVYKFYDAGRQQTSGKCSGCSFKSFGPVKKSNRKDVYAVFNWK